MATSRVKSYRVHQLHTWTEEEIAAFEARWHERSKQRLAVALLLYTGQRGLTCERWFGTDIVGTIPAWRSRRPAPSSSCRCIRIYRLCLPLRRKKTGNNLGHHIGRGV